MSVSVVLSVDHLKSFHVRDFPFKVWVGGSSIFSEETKQFLARKQNSCGVVAMVFR